MDKPTPRKVIEMAISTCHQESSRDGIGVGSLFAIAVNEMSVFRAIRVWLNIEETGIVFSQQATLYAPEPSRERPNRNADLTFGRKWACGFIRHERRYPQPRYLRPEDAADGSKQTSFFHRNAPVDIPPMQAHGYYRKVGKVDECTWAIGPQQLTGPDLSDLIYAHPSPPSDVPPGDLNCQSGASRSFETSIMS